MDDSIKYWFLCLLKLLVKILDYVTDLIWETTYTGGTRTERLKSQNEYRHSAQVVKILWRAKHHISSITRSDNFLYEHVEYVDTKTILERRNITLMSVEKDFALFAVSDPNVDVYDSKKFPFVFISLYQNAEKLIVLPKRSFHRLAEESGDPKVNVAMMAMTARCSYRYSTKCRERGLCRNQWRL